MDMLEVINIFFPGSNLWYLLGSFFGVSFSFLLIRYGRRFYIIPTFLSGVVTYLFIAGMERFTTIVPLSTNEIAILAILPYMLGIMLLLGAVVNAERWGRGKDGNL